MIQYCIVRVGASDDDTQWIPVSDLNSCLGVKSLRMVGQARSAIVLAGTSRSEESGKICDGVKETSAISPSYQGNNL